MAHAVESHPQRQYIIDALLNGRPVRAIAATLDPPIHFTALQRYKLKVIRPAVNKAVAVAKLTGNVATNTKTIKTQDISEVESAAVLRDATNVLRTSDITEPYLARIREHQQTVDSAIGFACDNEDPRSVAALIATDLKGLELHARLCGVSLDGAQTAAGANINLAVMVSVPRSTVDDPAPSVDVTCVDVPHA